MLATTLNGHTLLGEDRFIDAPSGRRLRVMVAGPGEDLVLLESGLGMSGLYWGPVHAALAQRTRVVAYERAGYGASTPAATPRDLDQLAADLATLVAAIPHRRLVLVGHSWGGPIVRVFAAKHAASGGSVHGIVLVDQSDEHAAALYTSRLAQWSDAVQNRAFVPLARTHALARLLYSQLSGLPAAVRLAAVRASSTVTAAHTVAAENRQIGPGMAQLAAQPLQLGRMPMRVISGARHHLIDRGVRQQLIRAHQQTTAAHPNATHLFATKSGHMIPVTEPKLIAAAALELLHP